MFLPGILLDPPRAGMRNNRFIFAYVLNLDLLQGDTTISEDWSGSSVSNGDFLNTATNDHGVPDAVIHLKFDEGTGATAYNAINSSEYSGTLTDGPTWETGKIGSGLQFDGIDDTVIFSPTPEINVSSSTVAFWIKPAEGGVGFEDVWHPNSKNYWIQYDNILDEVCVYLKDDVGSYTSVFREPVVTTQHSFVLVSYDGSTVLFPT